MRIYPNYYNQSYYSQYQKNNYKKSVQKLSMVNPTEVLPASNVSFNGIFNLSKFIKKMMSEPIDEFVHFNKEEYLKLSEAQKDKMRTQFNLIMENENDNLRLIGEINAYISDCVKTMFDKEFGEGKYVVLPIGRSLSTIGKSLGVKIGEENVIDVPLSNAYRFFNPFLNSDYKVYYDGFVDKLKNDKGLKTFLKFLQDNNLSRSDIENSGKNYILIDYCLSGNSLKGAEQLFKSDFVWGNKKRNIFAVDILRLMENFEDSDNLSKLSSYNLGYRVNRQLENILYDSEYKAFATIGNSPTLADTIRATQGVSDLGATVRERKFVWFKLLDSVIAKGDDFKSKLKPNLGLANSLPNQKVSPWNDAITQYITDLRDDMNDVIKLMIKYDSKPQSDVLNGKREELAKLYSFLEKCCGDRRNLQCESDYYKRRDEIQKIIDELSSQIV